jgi:hypothetical protein
MPLQQRHAITQLATQAVDLAVSEHSAGAHDIRTASLRLFDAVIECRPTY